MSRRGGSARADRRGANLFESAPAVIAWIVLAVALVLSAADLLFFGLTYTLQPQGSWESNSVWAGLADYGLRLHPGSLPAADYAGIVGSVMWAPTIAITGTFLLAIPASAASLIVRYRHSSRTERQQTHMRDLVDLEALNDEVLEVVTGALHPSHATLWLRSPRIER